MGKETTNYVFVFTDSIDSTDVQHKELESLLRISRYELTDVRDIDMQKFLNPRSEALPENIVERCNLKQSVFLRTCAKQDLLDEIISRSSYIHSCGILVFSSQMDHALLTKVQSAIQMHLDNNEINSCELSFFTNDRFGTKAGKQKGLLIDQKRYFLADLPFDQVQKHISNWDKAGRISFDEDSDVQARIWGFADVCKGREIETSWNYPEKNDEIYLVLYQPIYRARNPLYDLDSEREAKPYWKGIDTTPQQLMGAMLNLACVGKDDAILEPFVHTGSLPLEAAKLKFSELYYSDIFESIGAKDNLEFLSLPPKDLLNELNEIESLVELKTKAKTVPTCNDIYTVAKESITWVPDKPYPIIQSINENQRKYRWLEKRCNRLLFYIIRRFLIERKIGWMVNDTQEPDQIYGGYKKEGDLRKSMEDSITNSLQLLRKYQSNRLKIGRRRKSRGLIDIGYEPISQAKCKQIPGEENVDIMKGIPLADNTITSVVTDPPYGYGSSLEQKQIYKLYQRFFEEVFRVLKPSGRLTMCVLDKVRTGKDVDPEVMTTGVVSLANDVAKKNSISFVVDSIRPFSRDSRFLSYWKAQYKLNRGILTFQINK